MTRPNRAKSVAAQMPTVTEIVDASQTAGKISNGVVHPAAARTLATVVGINWIEAELQTTSIQRESEATPGLLRLILLAASKPKGVAALPSPSKLAETLAEMVSIT